MNRCVKILTVLANLMALAACTGQQVNPEQQVTTPETSLSATSSAVMSRGLEESYLPHWIEKPEEELAANFVRYANTPDARLDEKPTQAWRRASMYCTPDLEKEIQNQKDKFGDEQWKKLLANDGYISVEITNIDGAAQQAEGETTEKSEITLEVMFRRIYHQNDKETHEQTINTWSVTVTDGKISEFQPE
jgi:lipoprotein